MNKIALVIMIVMVMMVGTASAGGYYSSFNNQVNYIQQQQHNNYIRSAVTFGGSTYNRAYIGNNGGYSKTWVNQGGMGMTRGSITTTTTANSVSVTSRVIVKAGSRLVR